MRPLLRLALVLCLGMSCQPGEEAPGSGGRPAPGPEPLPNTLTPEEIAAGWRLLFDGASTDGWRGYNREVFPRAGWEIAEGDLIAVPLPAADAGPGSDIVSTEVFSDFELSFEFLVTPEGNSGVFFRVMEDPERSLWQVAPEYQILDDSAYLAMGTMDMRTHLTGDNYDLHSSRGGELNPPGEWNRGGIRVAGRRVEHWLNGRRVLEYQLLSPEWEALVAGSKFAPYPSYGRASAGRIGIQHHGQKLRYRNIKIRPIR
jgi:hypothetical protein